MCSLSVSCVTVSLALSGMLVLFCSPTRGHPCHFVSDNMKRIYQSVEVKLALHDSSVGAKPLFSPMIQNLTSYKRCEQCLLMNASLDIYLRIFSRLLSQTQTQTLLDQAPSSRSDLEELQKYIVELKRHLYQDRVKSVLHSLDSMQVDDVDVQRKALAEFKKVFQAASLIGSKNCTHS